VNAIEFLGMCVERALAALWRRLKRTALFNWLRSRSADFWEGFYVCLILAIFIAYLVIEWRTP